MKHQRIETINDILGGFLNLFLWLSLWITAEELLGINTRLSLKLIFVFVSVLLYFVRKYINNFWLYTLAHVVILAGVIVFVYAPVRNKVVVIAAFYALLLYSFVSKIKHESPAETVLYPLVIAGVILIEIFVLNKTGHFELSGILPKVALLYGGLYLIYLYFRRLLWFDFINKKVVSDVPLKSSIKTGAPLVFGISAGYIVISLLIFNEELMDRLSQFLLTGLRRFLRWIFSFIDFSESTEKAAEEIAETVIDQKQEMLELFPDSEPSKLAKILETIFIYATFVVVLCAILFGLVYGVYYLYSHFRKNDESDEIELSEDITEVREKISTEKKAKEKENTVFLSYSQRIRKQYIKVVKANGNLSDNPNRLTAREFAELFQKDKKEEALKLASLYEKARYSQKSCTKEDVKLSKQYASNLI